MAGIVSGEASGPSVLHLIVERLLLHPVGLRLGDGIVELIEARDDDVLAVLERERVLVFAILRHRPLAAFDLLLLLDQLLREPLEARDHVLAPQLEVLLHVLFGERVDGARGEGGSAETKVTSTSRLFCTGSTQTRDRSAPTMALSDGIAVGRRRGRQLAGALRNGDATASFTVDTMRLIPVGAGPAPLNSATLPRSSR